MKESANTCFATDDATARVLLVEDDDRLRPFLCEVLEQECNAGCDCTSSKAEAATALQANRYDLVVTDLRLPDGSGHDVASLASAAGTKALVMSGHPDDMAGLSASGIDHLKKPFRVRDFIDTVKRRLGP